MDSGFTDEVISSNTREKKENSERTLPEKYLFFPFPKMTLLTNKTDSGMFMDG